jgi:N-acetylglucosamine kinase-like BadF-type ATPase
VTGSGYVIGADGGNSKTDLVLAAAADGAVLARVTGGGTRPQVEGVAATADLLARLVAEACDRAGLGPDTPIEAACFLLANVDFAHEEATMHAALTERRLARRIEVGNDTLAVLRAGSQRGWGIGIVSGAGINAIGRHPDGRLERFLGIGSLSGDWGGGWGVAVAGLGAAVRAGDGRGPATVLRELIERTYGTDPESLAVAADRDEATERRLLGFAPVVFAAALDGDPVSVGIVQRLGEEVVDYVRALVARMDLADREVDVVLGGGLLQSGNAVLLERVRCRLREVAPRASLVVLDVPPVAGALATALTLAGRPAAEASAAARAALGGPALA